MDVANCGERPFLGLIRQLFASQACVPAFMRDIWVPTVTQITNKNE
jgi:hypothetical protein